MYVFVLSTLQHRSSLAREQQKAGFSSSDRLRPPDEWWKILGSRSTSQFMQRTRFWENVSLDRNGRRPDPEEEATALTRFRNIQHRRPKAIEQQHFGSSWSGRLRLPDEGPKMFLNQCTNQLKQPTGRKLLTDFIDLIGLHETRRISIANRNAVTLMKE